MSQVPNTGAKQVLKAAIQKHPGFIALPDAEQLPAEHAACFVPQKSHVWDDLHRGRVTGRHINAALGLSDASRLHKATGRMKQSNACGSLDKKMCYENLCESATPVVPGFSLDAPGAYAIKAHNESELDGSEALHVERQSLKQQSAHAAHKGIKHVRMLFGQVAEHRATCELLAAMPAGTHVHESGLVDADVLSLCSFYGVDPARVPHFGASPDNILVHGHPRAEEAPICEPIEIKSITPFREHHGRPFNSVSAINVAQVQLAIAATGCSSGVFVSFTPTRGIRAWRIHRSDDFICTALQQLAAFNELFVEKRQEPVAGYSHLLPFTASLIIQCLNIAREAECILDRPNDSEFQNNVHVEAANWFL